MTLDWRTPFEFALDLALFSIGWLLIIFIVLVGAMITVSLLRGFFAAVRKTKLTR